MKKNIILFIAVIKIMDKPTNGIGYEFDERIFRKGKDIVFS